MSTNGKGSARRPGIPGAYEKNYPKIFRRKTDMKCSPPVVNGIVCPKCGNRLEVAYTRQRPGVVRRVRRCPACGLRAPTAEKVLGS